MGKPEVMPRSENGYWKGGGAMERGGHKGRNKIWSSECPVLSGTFRCPGEAPRRPAGVDRRDWM